MKLLMNRLMTVAVGLAVVLSVSLPEDAEAKRFGGARSQGMQRDMPARQAPNKTPAQPAQPGQAGQQNAGTAAAAPAAAGAAAAAGKRSWLGPIAGLAAGLGLAALFSSMGLGAELANFVMLALLGVGAFFLVRFLMARFGGSSRQASMAGAGTNNGKTNGNSNDAMARTGFDRQPEPQSTAPVRPVSMPDYRPGAANAGQVPGEPVSVEAAVQRVEPEAIAPAKYVPAAFVPASFDSEGFERIAKMIFIRMQTANDAGDLNDLRRFTTPEMFAAVRLEIQDRNGALQTTDVPRVDAKVLDVAEEDGRQVVSVQFTGSIVEEAGGAAADFNEIWHLVKDAGSADSAWAIAGIEQSAKA
jgi:predicted lipid-binding transport protein (Tim44 family)